MALVLRNADAIPQGSSVDPVKNEDTVHHRKAAKSASVRITTRVHSLGLFGYAGHIANENPSADVGVVYDRAKWGCLLIKAFDLYDLHSGYNFTLGLFYTNIKLSEKLTFTPYGGFALDQEHRVADEGSDAMALLITTYRFDRQFSFEHCARFSNCVIDPRFFDWLNRFKLTYSKDHLDLMLMCWHNNAVFDSSHYTSVGLNASYSRLKISEKVTISSGITALIMAEASEGEAFVKRNGLLLTIATVIH
jgi:hypothetical protein